MAIGLFAIVSAIAVMLLTRGMRLTARENAYIELEQTSHFLLQNVESDLLHSGISGVSYGPPGNSDYAVMAVNRVADVTAEGQLVWDGEQAAYLQHKPSKNLKRLLINRGDPLNKTPRTLSPGDFDALTALPNPEVELVLDGVETFLVRNDRSDNSSRLVHIDLLLTRPAPGNEKRTYRVQKTIALRN